MKWYVCDLVLFAWTYSDVLPAKFLVFMPMTKRIVSVGQPGFVPVVKRVSGAQHSLPIFQSSSTSDRKLGHDDKRTSLLSYSFEDEDGESYR